MADNRKEGRAARLLGRPMGVVAALVGSFAVYALAGLGVVYFTGSPVAGAAGSSVAALACFAAVRRLSTGSFRAPGSLPVAARGSLRPWLLAVGALAGAFLLGQGLAVALYARFGSPAYDLSRETMGSAPVWLVLLTTLLLAPVGEEALMRGVFYDRLSRVWPLWAAAVASSALFALLHGNIVQVAATLPMALVLCAVYTAFGRRLWVVVAGHALFNLAALAVPSQVIALAAHPAAIALLVLAAAMPVVALLEVAGPDEG